jgi:hypothetical protein
MSNEVKEVVEEKETVKKAPQFISAYGQKISSGEHYSPEDDTTDQRAPVNNIDELYNQFVLPMDVMDELDHEKIDDFDEDVYDYDDRSEYGEDVAAAGQIDLESYIAEKQQEQAKKSSDDDKKSDAKPADKKSDVKPAD